MKEKIKKCSKCLVSLAIWNNNTIFCPSCKATFSVELWAAIESGKVRLHKLTAIL